MDAILTLSQGKEIITNGAEKEHRPEFTNRHMYIPSHMHIPIYPFHIPQVRKHKETNYFTE